MKGSGGMMPACMAPGTSRPGVLGPSSSTSWPARAARTASMSFCGTPSVMQTMRAMPASAASRTASAAPTAGTKITDRAMSCAATAAATVS